jgi:hypothetical protein
MTGNQLIQEIRRVLRCLSVIHTHAHWSYAHVYEVVQAKREKKPRHLAKVDASLLLAMEQKGLVAMEQGGDRTVFLDVIGRQYLTSSPANAPKFFITPQGLAFLSVNPLDPDPHAAQHRHLVERVIAPGGRPVTVLENAKESPLAWLRHRDKSRSWLSDEEFEAGERLRNDFELSGLSAKVTATWDKPLNTAAFWDRADLTVAQLDARRRFNAALRFLGPDLSDITVNVCCFHTGIELIEKARSWPTRSAKLLLRVGLRRLAEHYGLIHAQLPDHDRV